jgi:hypothetical protein
LDRAYWIIWYDLPAQERDAYLAWVHGSCIPKMLALPGVAWGAHYASEANVAPLGGGKGRVSRHASAAEVPQGDGYILMFGAAEPHVFADPGRGAFNAGLSGADRKMLALRSGERSNIMIEEARIHGPEAKKPEPDAMPGPCIQLGSFNSIDWRDEEDMARWYAQWRLPSLKTLPGVIRVRKLVSVAGWAKHACFYEFTSLEARNRNFVHYEASRPDMEAWSKEVVRKLVHATPLPIVARRTWPPLN